MIAIVTLRVVIISIIVIIVMVVVMLIVVIIVYVFVVVRECTRSFFVQVTLPLIVNECARECRGGANRRLCRQRE